VNSRGFYVALGIFAAAVLLYWLVEVQKVGSNSGTSARPSPAASPLIKATASDFDRVVIKSTAGKKQLVVVRSGSSWTYGVCASDQSDCPMQPADPIKAGVVAADVAILTPSRTIFQPEALQIYGVDKATTGEVDFTVKGVQHTLLIGLKTPDGSAYWAHLDSSATVAVLTSATVETTLLGEIDSPPAPTPTPSPSPSTGASPAPSASTSAPAGPGVTPSP